MFIQGTLNYIQTLYDCAAYDTIISSSSVHGNYNEICTLHSKHNVYDALNHTNIDAVKTGSGFVSYLATESIVGHIFQDSLQL